MSLKDSVISPWMTHDMKGKALSEDLLLHRRIVTGRLDHRCWAYSPRVHFFERFLRANIVDILRLGGMLPLSEAADPRLLLCASDPDPRRPPPSLPLPPRPRPRATGTRSSPLGFETNENENMSIECRRTYSSDQIANRQRAPARRPPVNPSCCGSHLTSSPFRPSVWANSSTRKVAPDPSKQ